MVKKRKSAAPRQARAPAPKPHGGGGRKFVADFALALVLALLAAIVVDFWLHPASREAGAAPWEFPAPPANAWATPT